MIPATDREVEPSTSENSGRRFPRGTSPFEHALRSGGRDDLRLARDFQRSLLPPIPDAYHGIRMAAAYYPAFDVGGDFYELITGPDLVQVIIGDVSGKGVSAALVMSRIMAEFRRRAQRHLPPDELFGEVNDFLISAGFGDCFVTACCIEINLRERRMSVANAGHVPALLRHSSGDVSLFGEASGAPLGLFEGEAYRCETRDYGVDDIVVLVTDGVTEALEPLADLTTGVLTDVVKNASHDVRSLARDIVNSVTKTTREEDKGEDDVALFALQLT